MHADARLRLFVAVYPPHDVVHRLLDLLRTLDLAPHRTTPPEQVHLTLQFIGPTQVRDLPEVEESIARSVRGISPFDSHVLRLMSLPRRARVRLIAAELDQPPALMEIQRRLATRLARNVRQRPGDRFLPHMTLCRFDRAASPRDVDTPVHHDLLIPVREVNLMKSVLRPRGAEHAVVRTIELTT